MSTLARGLFVTGTDTGVGKTAVACGLIRAIAAQGHRVVGMKPVAAGARVRVGGLRNADVEALRAAGTLRAARKLINPYLYAAPIAPHIAACEAQAPIDPRVIVRAYRALTARADVVVVEGVGGFCVPLNARFDTADLVRRLRLPVIMVVGMRLGCLSHALLTAEAIARRGLHLAGWVANRIDPDMRRARANVRALRERLDAPLLAEIAYCARPSTLRAELHCRLQMHAVAALIGVGCASRKHPIRSV